MVPYRFAKMFSEGEGKVMLAPLALRVAELPLCGLLVVFTRRASKKHRRYFLFQLLLRLDRAGTGTKLQQEENFCVNGLAIKGDCSLRASAEVEGVLSVYWVRWTDNENRPAQDTYSQTKETYLGPYALALD